MVKRLLALVLLAAVLAVSGCALAGGPAIPVGLIYTDVKAPLDTDMDKTSLGTKTGKAEAVGILGLVATGDASTEYAAEKGNIMTINHADFEFFSLLGLYSRFTTVVHGD